MRFTAECRIIFVTVAGWLNDSFDVTTTAGEYFVEVASSAGCTASIPFS
jgi:hypothetical protein